MCTIEKRIRSPIRERKRIRGSLPRSVTIEKEETSRFVSQWVGSSAEGLFLRDSVAHSRELGENV